MRLNKYGAGLVLGVLGLSGPGPAAAKEIWVAPTHFQAPLLNTLPWSVTGAGYASFSFAVPHDFESLRSVTLSLIPKGEVSGTFDVYGSVKRDGELAGDELLYTLAVPATLTANTLQEIDLTSLLVTGLDSTSGGADYVGVFFYFPASPGLVNAHVVGLRFAYESVPLASGDLADESVTNAKLADNSIGTAKVADGSLRREDIDRDEVQARVTGTCPEGQSIRSITNTGEVRCQSIGLEDYRIETATVTCQPGSSCRAVAACPPGKRVTGGGHLVSTPSVLPLALNTNSYPEDSRSWTATWSVVGNVNVEVVAYAICSAEGEAVGAVATASAARR